MTDFDRIRNIMICFEEGHQDKTRALNEIAQVCFSRDAKISEVNPDTYDDDWDMK